MHREVAGGGSNAQRDRAAFDAVVAQCVAEDEEDASHDGDAGEGEDGEGTEGE